MALSLCEARVEPFGKYLPHIDVNSRRIHVPRIRRPQFVIDIGTFPKIGRKRSLEYAWNTVVCATAYRSGHDDDIARAQQDRNWRDITRETTHEEDCGVSEGDGNKR